MRITKFGHACLLLEEGSARILTDPGSYSRGFEELTDLNAVLITHQHADHLDVAHAKGLITKNPGLKVYADEGSAALLVKEGVPTQAVHAGDEFDVAGVKVEVLGQDHAIIHADIPRIPNVCYLVNGTFFYPGDSLTLPERPIEVLALPLVAPWLRVGEMVDYLRAVGPKVAIPVHDAITSAPAIYLGAAERLTAGRGIEVRLVENGTSTEV